MLSVSSKTSPPELVPAVPVMFSHPCRRYGDLTVTGSLLVGGARSSSRRLFRVASKATATLLVQSGRRNGSTLALTPGQGARASLVLDDTAEGHAARFRLESDGATPNVLSVLDAGRNVLLVLAARPVLRLFPRCTHSTRAGIEWRH